MSDIGKHDISFMRAIWDIVHINHDHCGYGVGKIMISISNFSLPLSQSSRCEAAAAVWTNRHFLTRHNWWQAVLIAPCLGEAF